MMNRFCTAKENIYQYVYMEVNRITVKTVLQGILLDQFLFRRYFTKQASSSVVKI